MMSISENSFTPIKMERIIKVETEPMEEEAEEILPDLPEPPVSMKSEHCEATPNNDINCIINQENSGIQINNPYTVKKTLVEINGIYYYLEQIPAPLIQKPLTENIAPQVKESINYSNATCPKCGKTLKQSRNLRRHMQMCYNTCIFTCEKCNYTTASGHYWLLHSRQCGNSNRAPTNERIGNAHAKVPPNERIVNCLCICLKCNTSTSLYSENCSKCGSKNNWECKICSLTFKSWEKVRRHLRTKCKPDFYYHCRMCDYKHALRYYVYKHIFRNHEKCRPCESFIDKRRVSTDPSNNHVCSLCNIQFEDVPGLNRHTFFCKKYELYSRGKCEKIKTNGDVSQPDTNSAQERKSFRQFIVRHCSTCNEDFELESQGVSIKKCCVNCSSPLKYKCKKCGKTTESYDTLVKHVKAICHREQQFKCTQCDFIGFSFSRLTQHYKIHGDISATCTNCGSFFINSNTFKKHIKRCGFPATFQCDICSYRSTTKGSFVKHIKNHDTHAAPSNCINNEDSQSSSIPEIQPYCTKCCRHQTSNQRLKSCKLCNSELQFRCSTCNKMYSIDDADACKHIKNYIELLSLECKNCSKRFSNKDKYNLHENSCWETKYYRCQLCSYSTRYETFFRLHNRKEHQIGNRSRKLENQNESQEIEMKIAKVLHLCQYCPYESRTKAGLQNHSKIHLVKNDESNSMSHQKSNRETVNHGFDGDRKLNVQCKVVLTRLDRNSI